MKHPLPLPARRVWRYLQTALLFLAGLGAGTASAQSWGGATTPDNPTLFSNRTVSTASAVDAAGNQVVVGSFRGKVGFGSTSLSTSSITDEDLYVGKLNGSTGAWQWAVGAGSTAGLERLQGVAVSPTTGDITVVGFFSGTLTLGSTTLTSAGGADLLVARLNGSTGAWQWATRVGSTGSETANAVAVDANGVVTVLGSFTSPTLQFGTNAVLTKAGTGIDAPYQDLFVAQLSANGSTWNWSVRGGGANAETPTSIALGPGNSVTIAGSTNSTTATFGSTTLSNTGGQIFVARLTSAGTWTWAAGSSSANGGGASNPNLVVDASTGAVTLTAQVTNNATFGSLGALSTNSASTDILLAQLSNSGTWTRATAAGGTATDAGRRIVALPGGAFAITGSFEGTVTLGSSTLTGAGTFFLSDTFVGRYETSTNTWAWAVGGGGDGLYADEGLGLNVSGNRLLLLGSFYSNGRYGSYTVAVPEAGGGDSQPGTVVAGLNAATGAWEWVNQINHGSTSEVQTTAIDAAGNEYVAGVFSGVLTLGSTQLVCRSLDRDLFVARRAAGTGTWTWAERGLGSTSAMTVDPSGSTLTLVGSFSRLGADNFSPGALVLRLNAGTGARQWAASATGTAALNGLALRPNGDAVVVGRLAGSATFGSLPALTSNSGSGDVLVAGLDNAGNWTQALRAGGSNDEAASYVALAADGSIVLAGSYANAATFGTLPTLFSYGSSSNGFVARLSAGNTWTQAVRLGNASNHSIRGLGLDPAANALVVGYFSGTLNLGSSPTLTSAGTTDTYVTSLSPSGTWNWAARAGSSGSTLALSAVTDAGGQTTIAGSLGGSATFGTLPTLTSNGESDVFVARIRATDGTWLGVLQGGGTRSEAPFGKASINASGTVLIGGYLNAPATFGSTNLLAPTLSFSRPTAFLARVQPPVPTILSLTPDNGPVGSTVVISGTELGGATAVAFNGTAATFTPNPDGSLTASVPAGATTGAVSVVTGGGTATSSGPFTVTAPLPTPSISGLSPASGYVGTVVTLTGTNLTNASAVTFNGTNAPGFTVNSATQLTVSVPTGATTGRVTVTTPSGTATSSTDFTVLLAPDLTVGAAQTISGTYTNVTITGTGVATLGGALTVNGTLTVQSGGQLLTACQPLSGPGSFSLAAGATLGICDAAGISTSGASGAVQLTGARSFSPDALYLYNGTAAQVTGPGLPAAARELTVATTGGNLTLTSSLDVAQVLRLVAGSATAGNLDLGGRTLTLRSGAAGTALLVNGGAGQVLASTGTCRMERYIDPATNAGPGYRHMASPVTGMTVGALATTGFTPVLTQAYNTSTTPNAVTPFPNVFGYDQDRLSTSPASGYSAFDKGWVVPTAATPMGPATGYTVNVRPTALVTFTGSGFTQTTTNRQLGGSGPQADAGWVLTGNPFPGGFDLSVPGSTSRVNVGSASYVFESTSQYGGQYRSYINGFGNPLLAAGQAFFVRMTTPGQNATITFDAAGRQTTFGAQAPFRRGTPDLRPQVRLTLRAGSFSDDAYVYAEAGATDGIDANFDALKLPNSNGLGLAALTGTSSPLAIQGLPALTASTVVPLQVLVPAAGPASFTASLGNLPAGLTAYLYDAATSHRQDIAATPAYAFTATQAGAQPGRFTLVFGAASVLSTRAGVTELALYPNPARQAATLSLPAAAQNRPVQVLDALGRVVRTEVLPAAATRTVLPLAGLPAGVYTVRCAGRAARLVVE